jgi:hypothetical protein
VLPLIVIGATEEIQELVRPELPLASFYPTAEEAHNGLIDASFADLNANGWNVHVAYGPHAFGPLATGRVGAVTSARLAHIGWTAILGHSVNATPGRPRRVIEGQMPSEAEDRSIWQAASAVSADLMLDMATPDAPQYLANWLGTR